MLEEKRKDLESERTKRLLMVIVEELSRTELDFYYRSTSDVALLLQSHIQKGARLAIEDRQLLSKLSRRDIAMILSIR